MALVLATLVVGLAAAAGGWVFGGVTQGLPSVEAIANRFGPAEAPGFQPTRIFDRTGRYLIFEASNPAAAERRWLHVDPPAGSRQPPPVLLATIAIQDPGFWTNPGYELHDVITALLGGKPAGTITQQLVETALLPLDDHRLADGIRFLRTAVLAADLTRRFSKAQILEWYVNSAPYGKLAYGLDAAGLTYFGKHAGDLSLAESAMLAPLPRDPDRNPADAPQAARTARASALQAMVRQGWIDAAAAKAAGAESVTLRPIQTPTSDFGWAVWGRLEQMWGQAAGARSGLKVLSTQDHDLQLQAECVALTQAGRLAGGDPGAIEPASDGTACVAGSLLPPMRPGDTGVDHKMTDTAVVVLDPTAGEVLSLVGPAQDLRPTGPAFQPFLYLTAFARGYTAGTMVLDLPLETTPGVPGTVAVGHGPVRMRTALANSYTAAAQRTLALAGVEDVVRTAHQMGVSGMDDPTADYQPALETGESAASLLDVTGAYGVLANDGRMVGVAPDAAATQASQGLEPVFILSVQDYDGHALPLGQIQERAVVSPQLAFILEDVLSDDTARWPAYGPSSVLEIGQPAGAVAGSPPDGHDNWAIGFTRRRVVGAWVGNRTTTPLNAITALNGAAPIWHAVLQYASRELPSEGWAAPAGVSTLQVCDPSGLLPTSYCPEVMREVFVQGTEPTHYDTLYQPFRVNKETGKLATLFTPVDLVQEKVYLVPPPEAAVWARQAGIPQPPTEYDTIVDKPAPNPDVSLTRPAMFAYVHGVVSLQGSARPKGMQYYRLQFGAGLNPTRWTQIGTDVRQAVVSNELGKWDTQGLSGLYTLQLVAVLDQGQVMTDATPMTIDNSSPSITLVLPSDGQAFTLQDQVVIQADVSDDLALDRVEFYVDFRQVAAVGGPPYSARWQPVTPGEYTILARAYDLAGNMAESQKLTITIGK